MQTATILIAALVGSVGLTGWARSAQAVHADASASQHRPVFAGEDSLTVVVDVSQPQANPLVKSKLGFARAASFEQLPESVLGFKEIKPSVFCSELDFDDVEGRNYALEPDPFLVDRIKGSPNSWLKRLEINLRQQGVEPFYQIIGAPRPFQQKNIRRPAIHPTPTDISRSAALTAKWIEANFPGDQGRTWLLWNEPSHTLRGVPTSAAARDMADIFSAYRQEIKKIDAGASLGYAAFIANSLKNVPEKKGISFLERVFELTHQRENFSDSVDLININSYFGRIDEMVETTNMLLRKYESRAPLLLSQFAPPSVAEKDSVKNSIESAYEYVKYYDYFVSHPSISHVCFSYWSGPSRQAFYRFDPRRRDFKFGPNYHALYLYQQLPLWRPKVDILPGFDGAILAGYDDDQVGFLTFNTSSQSRVLNFKIKGAAGPYRNAKIIYFNSDMRSEAEPLHLKGGAEVSVKIPAKNGALVMLGDDDVLNGLVAKVDPRILFRHGFYFRGAHNPSQQGVTYYDRMRGYFVSQTENERDLAGGVFGVQGAPAKLRLYIEASDVNKIDSAVSCLNFYVRNRSSSNQVKGFHAKGAKPLSRDRMDALGFDSVNFSILKVVKTGNVASTEIPLPKEEGIDVYLTQSGCPAQLQTRVKTELSQ